jgi:hypothetical protein
MTCLLTVNPSQCQPPVRRPVFTMIFFIHRPSRVLPVYVGNSVVNNYEKSRFEYRSDMRHGPDNLKSAADNLKSARAQPR